MRRIFFLTACCLFTASAAFAAAPRATDNAVKPDMSKAGVAAAEQEFKELEGDARTQAITQIEAYLTGIPTLTADFTQTSSDGSTGDGKFFLKRPGKVRWQYNPPSNLLLVSNGKTMTYYDPELKQVTYVSVDQTLAGFVAQKEIKLEGKTTQLTHLMGNKQGSVKATLIQRKKPDEGSLTLYFTDKPFKINGITTIDATGNETQVALTNLVFGPTLDDKIFVFNDPRGVNDKRNKKR